MSKGLQIEHWDQENEYDINISTTCDYSPLDEDNKTKTKDNKPVTIFQAAYYPEELLAHMDLFTTDKSWVYIRHNDGYLPIYYKGKRCQFQTPYNNFLFGLEAYYNPDSKIKKYSINYSLKVEGDKEMENLVLFLDQLDAFTQIHQQCKKDIFRPSSEIQRRNKSPTLRIKIPSNRNILNIQLVVEYPNSVKTLNEVTVDEFHHYVSYTSKVSCVLMINNIWRADNKYGISYKLKALRVKNIPQTILFRN